MMSLPMVDASTGSTLSLKQAILRYLGYFVALLSLGLGILWVAFDKRKQGWQDNLAGRSCQVTNRSNSRTPACNPFRPR